MISDILKPYCTPNGRRVDAQSITDYDEDSITVLGVKNNGTYWVLTGDKITISNDDAEKGKIHSLANNRRLLGNRQLMAGGDDGADQVLTTGLPGPLDSCVDPNEYPENNPDLNKHEDYTCKSNSEEWSCDVTNGTLLGAKLRDIYLMQADDCWTEGEVREVKCDGAPAGVQNCAFTPLPAGQYAYGIKVTVNGDRCRACGYASPDACPDFYDVHNCQVDWIDHEGEVGTSDTPPSVGHTFTIEYEVNSAIGVARTSLVVSTLLLVAALVLSKP